MIFAATSGYEYTAVTSGCVYDLFVPMFSSLYEKIITEVLPRWTWTLDSILALIVTMYVFALESLACSTLSALLTSDSGRLTEPVTEPAAETTHTLPPDDRR